MNRRMWIVVSAVLVAVTLGGAVAVASSGESCTEWRARYRQAQADHLAAVRHGSDADLMSTLDAKLAVYDEKPEGC